MLWLVYIAVLVVAYFLGSIPTGFLAGRAKGIDVRSTGSGNIGATNAFRVLGKPAGTLVLLTDALKGYLAAAVVARIGLMFAPDATAVTLERLSILGGLAAVIGHNYTCWLRFKGGKGIATSAGVLIAWVPWALLVIFVTWLVVFLVSRYVSLASIVAAVVLPFAVWMLEGSRTMICITTGLSVMAIYKHRANIQRLLNGTENRIRFKSGAVSEAASKQ